MDRKIGVLTTPKAKQVTIPAVPGKSKYHPDKCDADQKVTITWNKTSNATSYRVFYKKSGAKKWITVANVSASKEQLHSFKQQRKLRWLLAASMYIPSGHTIKLPGNGELIIQMAWL